MDYCVKASAGDSACGGLDMDYLVARALLVSFALLCFGLAS